MKSKTKKSKFDVFNIFNIYMFLLVIAIIAIDRLAKIFIYDGFCEWYFCLKQKLNYGAAFGILPGLTWLFIIVAFILLIVICYFYHTNKPVLLKIGLVFIWAGTLSNLIDRIAFGYVVDFVSILGSSFFNLADLSNLVGAILVVLFLIFAEKQKK